MTIAWRILQELAGLFTLQQAQKHRLDDVLGILDTAGDTVGGAVDEDSAPGDS
jgi:hypothetical protein